MRFRLLTLIILILSFDQNLLAEDLSFRYQIFVNQQKQGIMSLKLSGNSFYSQYFNVSEDDRIPFFYPEKSGKFSDRMYSEELSFKNISYLIFNESKKVPDEWAIQKMYKRDDKALMLDKKSLLPKLIFDQIPMVCLESIIIGIRDKKISENQHLFLFEEGSKSQFIVYFIRNGESVISINNQNVKTEQITFMRKNIPGQPDKPVFEMNLCKNSLPVRIASISKRWELNLYKMGKEEKQQFDRTNEFLKIANNNIINHHRYSKKKAQIVNHQFLKDTFEYQYNVPYPLKKQSENELVKLYLRHEYLDKAYDEKGFFSKNLTIKKIGMDYSLFVSDLDICSEYKQYYQIDQSCQNIIKEHSKNIDKEMFIQAIQSKYGNIYCVEDDHNLFRLTIIETGKLLNCNEAVNYYIDNNPQLKRLGDPYYIECEPGYSDFLCGLITVRFKSKEKIDYNSPMAKEYAAKFLLKQLDTNINRKTNNNIEKIKKQLTREINTKKSYLILQESEGGYELRISSKQILNFERSIIDKECLIAKQLYTNSNFNISKSEPDYLKYKCTLHGKSNIPQSNVTLESTLFPLHDDLRFFKKDIITKSQFWIFPTIPKVINLCKE